MLGSWTPTPHPPPHPCGPVRGSRDGSLENGPERPTPQTFFPPNPKSRDRVLMQTNNLTRHPIVVASFAFKDFETSSNQSAFDGGIAGAHNGAGGMACMLHGVGCASSSLDAWFVSCLFNLV